MARIVRVMGTDDLKEYLRRYKLNLPKQIAKIIKPTEKTPFEGFITTRNQHRVSNEAINLLEKMLVYDKNERITPREALQHPFFAPIRKLQKEGTAE